jgi:hypothetical protein
MGDPRYIYNPNLRDNLLQNRLSGEELSRAASAAAKKSVEVRRKKKAMRDLAREILDLQLADEDDVRAELKKRGVEQTEAAAVLLAQLIRARTGDTEAARFLRDTSGQKPVDNVAIGNLDDKPFETLDLASLTEAQLKELIEEG